MTLAGIDISHFQATTPPLTSRSFVFVKASEGLVPDNMYATHAANVTAAGLVLGAYHFARADVATPEEQARYFIAAATGAELYALDVERTTYKRPDGTVVTVTPMTPAQASAFIAEMHRHGKGCGLYMSRSPITAYLACGQDWNWVADYRGITPNIPWAFWQYSDSGGALDLDYFNGDLAALNKLAGRSDVQLDPSISTGMVADFTPGATVYRDAARTIVFQANWPGGATIGVVGVDATNAQGFAAANVCVNLYEPTPPYARALVYVGADHMTNLRPRVAIPDTATPFSQADIDKAKLAGEQAGYDLAVTGVKVTNTPTVTFPPRPA